MIPKRCRNSTVPLIVAALGVLAGSTSAWPQGFMVKPMLMEFSARRGQVIERDLQLRNIRSDEAATLTIKTVLLRQGPTGAWMIVTAENGSTQALPSCLPWLRLSSTSVRIPPLEATTVRVRLQVPRGARGFYAGGILVQSTPRRGGGSIAVVIRFLIPVLLQIQAPLSTQDLRLGAVGMDYRPEADKRSATTEVWLTVINRGATYSRIEGRVDLSRQAGTTWRLLTQAPIRQIGITPNATLRLTADLARVLPSGRYKLDGTLFVDGLRTARMSKETDFEGDPSVATVPTDVPLMLDPPALTIKAVPGSRRTAVVTVQNPSDDALRVACEVQVPPGLSGVAMGSITGEDFTCAPWTEVVPQSFTLGATGQRNIRLTVNFARVENPKPNYYADLSLTTSYLDHQSAGKTQAMVVVQNPTAQSQLKAQPVGLTIAQQEGDRYAVTARFANIGNVHFTPSASARVVSPIGEVVAKAKLETTAGIVLPLGTPRFSGAIDFGNVKPGVYILVATMEYGGEEVSTKLPVRVETKEHRKLVTVLEKFAQ